MFEKTNLHLLKGNESFRIACIYQTDLMNDFLSVKRQVREFFIISAARLPLPKTKDGYNAAGCIIHSWATSNFGVFTSKLMCTTNASYVHTNTSYILATSPSFTRPIHAIIQKKTRPGRPLKKKKKNAVL